MEVRLCIVSWRSVWHYIFHGRHVGKRQPADIGAALNRGEIKLSDTIAELEAAEAVRTTSLWI